MNHLAMPLYGQKEITGQKIIAAVSKASANTQPFSNLSTYDQEVTHVMA